jgi:hypothetical protein
MLLAGGQLSLSGAFHWTDLIPAAVLVAAIVCVWLALNFVAFANRNANPSASPASRTSSG